MTHLKDYADYRYKLSCIHCYAAAPSSRDHVPSKAFLDEPLPKNLPVVSICDACNTGFSENENYLGVLLHCLLAGTTDSAKLGDTWASRALQKDRRLKLDIEKARSEDGLWHPDLERIQRVLLKNALGHYLYECGGPPDGDLVDCWARPLQSLGDAKIEFETVSIGSGWPEVGSRLLQRLVETGPPWDGWIDIQPSVYRYAIHEYCAVRIVLRNYLAFEATWG